jgi:hypothetical protein
MEGGERLRLSKKLAKSVDGHEFGSAHLWEESSRHPMYQLEVHYDNNGSISFTDGWEGFAVDYGLRHGFS